MLLLIIAVLVKGSYAAECDLTSPVIKDCQATITATWEIQEDTELINVDLECQLPSGSCVVINSNVTVTMDSVSIVGNDLHRCLLLKEYANLNMTEVVTTGCGYQYDDGGVIQALQHSITFIQTSIFQLSNAQWGGVWRVEFMQNITQKSISQIHI